MILTNYIIFLQKNTDDIGGPTVNEDNEIFIIEQETGDEILNRY